MGVAWLGCFGRFQFECLPEVVLSYFDISLNSSLISTCVCRNNPWTTSHNLLKIVTTKIYSEKKLKNLHSLTHFLLFSDILVIVKI